MQEIPNIVGNLKALWSKQQIRILAMVSLLMQMVLILFASSRKRSGNKLLVLLLWAVYLVSDHVATLALGSILTYTMDHIGLNLMGQNLVAFWAPFLLLHLGGPDNITSYSIEDNKLWWRHLIGVVTQVSVAFIVLVQSNLKSTKLAVPSLLIFLVGTTKFVERTLALRAASKDPVRDPFQHKPYLDRKLSSHASQHGESTDVSSVPGLILGGYNRYSIVTDRMVNISDKSGQQLLLGRKDKAFAMIDMELSFFYDVLHTKASLVHHWTGRVIRLASLVSIPIALVLFHVSDKRGHESIDVIITFVLLSMALILDFYSLLRSVASKQTTVSLMRLNKRWARKLAEIICRAMNRGKRRHWSGHMGQYSLIQSSVKSWVRDNVGRNILFKLKFVKDAWDFLFEGEKSAAVSEVLEKMIFEYVERLVAEVLEKKMREHVQLLVPQVVMEEMLEVEKKTQMRLMQDEPGAVKEKTIERVQELVTQAVVDDFYSLPKKFSSTWIANTLDRYKPYFSKSKDGLDRYGSKSKDGLEALSFEECVLAWHMATEMCYAALDSNGLEHREEFEAIYKVSKYLVHLLLKRESMMPPGIVKERVEDTSKQIRSRVADRFGALPEDQKRRVLRQAKASHGNQGSWIYKVPAEWLDGDYEREGRSACPLFLMIWEDLANTFVWCQWEVIRDAWMEMLMFAALHCSPTEHAKSLSSGGELLTHFWLLWAHDDFIEEAMENLKPRLIQVCAHETRKLFTEKYAY